MGGRGVDGGVRRLLAAVAAGARPGGGARGALLRAEPRAQDHLRQPEPLALRPGRSRTRHEAQLELLRAYLAAYGPATPAHLARWLATSPAWATELFERADLDEVELEGEPAWVWAGDTAFDAPEAPAVRLLPYFDAFQVGSQPRALLFPGRASERALAGAQAGNYPVLLLDGVVGGVWHQKRSGRG